MRMLLKPLQKWVWKDPARRGLRLLYFAEVEDDSGHHMVRAAELTPDPRLRQLYLRHAGDERRHAQMFRQRGIELVHAHMSGELAVPASNWLAPGERGLDELNVDDSRDGSLLAFLHLSERDAARDFAVYREAVGADGRTRAVFERVLRDEEHHMNYTREELARVSPEAQGRLLWTARLNRIWKAYLRFAVAFAGLIGSAVFTLQYFILLPPFAWICRRAAAREPEGWTMLSGERPRELGGQY